MLKPKEAWRTADHCSARATGRLVVPGTAVQGGWVPGVVGGGGHGADHCGTPWPPSGSYFTEIHRFWREISIIFMIFSVFFMIFEVYSAVVSAVVSVVVRKGSWKVVHFEKYQNSQNGPDLGATFRKSDSFEKHRFMTFSVFITPISWLFRV